MCGIELLFLRLRVYDPLRMNREQRKTREDEVFLGSSAAERAEYEKKEDRINELERDLPEKVRLSFC